MTTVDGWSPGYCRTSLRFGGADEWVRPYTRRFLALQLERQSTSSLESLPAMPSEPLEVEVLDRGVLSFRGPLTMENVTPFMNAVRRETAPTMILDFSGVPYLDSSGLGSLVSACTSCAKAGRRIAITGVNKRVLKVFEITKVEQILLMFPTLSDAIEAFTNAGTA